MKINRMTKRLMIPMFFGIVLTAGLMSCTEVNKKAEDLDRQELESQFLEKGASITAATFQTMSANLKNALTEGGVPSAIKYCNANVDSLMEDLSKVHQVDIRRTSDRVRNPLNTGTVGEMEVVRRYQSNLKENKLPEPLVEVADNKVHYYAPIILMENCLKCHGRKDQDIVEDDYAIIKGYYPEDQAYGFQIGELRGIWSLEFDRP